ncbi:MAG TPA: hypothetical protein VNT76_08155 [Candidatus Binatus sp.]|nr:hypothetical protein [Candidatus Binatus sp.]
MGKRFIAPPAQPQITKRKFNKSPRNDDHRHIFSGRAILDKLLFSVETIGYTDAQ